MPKFNAVKPKTEIQIQSSPLPQISIVPCPFSRQAVRLMQQVNIGIIGGGTVGGGVFDALQWNGDLLSSRIGVRVHVKKIAVRSRKKIRGVKIPKHLLTEN